MKITKRETVYRGKFIKIVAKHFETEDGKKGIWETVERNMPQKKAVIIFALTKDKEVILERIYRIPFECYVLELPAGLCDKENETEKEVAKRELLEETGYEAKKLIHVFDSTGDMALKNTEIVYFFAPDVQFIGNENRDDSEQMEEVKIPLEKLVDIALNPPQGIKISFDLLSVLPVLRKKGLV